jgi:small-conductance mechanosensitive channel
MAAALVRNGQALRCAIDYSGQMNELSYLLSQLGPVQYLVVAANLLLMLFAPRLIERFAPGKSNVKRFRITLMRGINLLILAAVLYPAFSATQPDERAVLTRLASIVVVIYLAYLIAVVIDDLVRRKYGKRQNSAEQETWSDTYHSRMLGLLISSFIGIVALITVIRLAGLSSLLEAGGVIGFIGVFLALTQAAWAPDIISGLLLLNSDMVSEGDVIEIDDGSKLLARVFKTKVFHTVLVDVIDNHRVMIGNARLRNCTIHNLSRFASARGLRERLVFKIGYDVSPERVKKLFHTAFDTICQDESIAIDPTHPLEIRVLDTGDHAVEWGVFYYIKEIVQKVKSRQAFMEEILLVSVNHDISLATPQTHVVAKADIA